MAPYLASVTGGLLMWAAFPPLEWGPLAFVAPAPLVWGLRRIERAGGAIGAGFLFGVVFFGLMLNWVLVLGAVAWIPLTLWLGITSALLGLVIWLFREWPPTRFLLLTVGVWALWELARATVPFGGFPWGLLGYAAGGTPGFIGSVQWVGPSGWSVLAVAFAVASVLTLEDRANWRLVMDSGVVIVLLAIAGGLFPPGPGGDSMAVAIVQGNSPCPAARCQNENQRIYESHLALTRTIDEAEVDLVVWPENATATPFEPVGNDEVEAALSAEASRIGAYLLVSGTRRAGLPEGEFLNVNRMYAPTGEFVGEYWKRHPVPFGEFVPFRDLLDFIPDLDRVPRDMVRGSEATVFPTPRGTVGSVISFEGAFSRLVRSEAQAGAELMIVATNESSYGTRSGLPSDQLIALTRVNAAAVGQDLVHAAITGKSAFITAAGTVGERTEIFTEALVVGRVTFRTGARTLFTRFGDWVLW
ncbi:MAG: apolipoprotein N-acyltransferase, partial [Acidimicrobiia bacterium]